MAYREQNAKRLGTSAKLFGVSSTAVIPPNVGFRVPTAGTYRFVPRLPFPGDTSATAIAVSLVGGAKHRR